jgi:DnaJ-class molecular chaperone
MMRQGVTCPRCRGKGLVTRRDFWIKGVTGHERYGKRVCPDCLGSGRVEESPPRPPLTDDSPF